MAMLTCAECGNDASTSAKTCPHCGASRKAMRYQPRTPMPRWQKIVLGLVLVGVMVAISISADKTPAQLEADKKEQTLATSRWTMAVGVLHDIKASLRNPDSLLVERLLTNDGGDVVCLRYRAQNGFGGMDRASFVMAGSTSGAGPRIWNRHCTDEGLHDLTSQASSMLQIGG